uniref:Uncharacterized protein n=1 Tax=Lepeophtheirus salmonis TaxID=72036 RepID=A0A0K2TF28_LEPSM
MHKSSFTHSIVFICLHSEPSNRSILDTWKSINVILFAFIFPLESYILLFLFTLYTYSI